MQKVDLLLRTKVLLKANFINLDYLSYYRTWNLFCHFTRVEDSDSQRV